MVHEKIFARKPGVTIDTSCSTDDAVDEPEDDDDDDDVSDSDDGASCEIL